MCMRRAVIVLGMIIAGASSAGCASRFPPAVPYSLSDQAQVPGFGDIRCWGDQYSPLVEKSILDAARQQQALGLRGKEVAVLAISGGGSDGAYGAGLLCGWTQMPATLNAHPRPDFNVVTGISTGALIAPFAFLGPQYDQPLREAYTSVSMPDIGRVRPLLTIPFDSSVFNTEPMKRLIRKYITAELIGAVAREHARGRRLFVITTNLDAQRPVIWDMGAIAAVGNDKAVKLFRDVLAASAAVPGVFEPVFLDVEAGGQKCQEMHVDGGATTQVFHVGAVLNSSRLLHEMGSAADELPRRVYVIRNGKMQPEWEDVCPNVLTIAERALTTLIKANAAGDIHRIYALCKFSKTEFRLACIPDEHKSSPKSFDNSEMRCVFNLGFQAGVSGQAWQDHPPAVVESQGE